MLRTQFETIRTEVNAAVPPRHDDHHIRDVLRETRTRNIRQLVTSHSKHAASLSLTRRVSRWASRLPAAVSPSSSLSACRVPLAVVN
mgnify:CR=1 FL=1